MFEDLLLAHRQSLGVEGRQLFRRDLLCLQLQEFRSPTRTVVWLWGKAVSLITIICPLLIHIGIND